MGTIAVPILILACITLPALVKKASNKCFYWLKKVIHRHIKCLRWLPHPKLRMGHSRSLRPRVWWRRMLDGQYLCRVGCWWWVKYSKPNQTIPNLKYPVFTQKTPHFLTQAAPAQDRVSSSRGGSRRRRRRWRRWREPWRRWRELLDSRCKRLWFTKKPFVKIDNFHLYFPKF